MNNYEDIILVLFAVNILLNLVDIFTTYAGLRLGAYERNELARKLYRSKGVRGLYFLKNVGSLALSIMSLTYDDPLLAIWQITIANAIVGIPAIWNSVVIAKLVYDKLRGRR